jgi:hypothetical protein
MGGGENGNGGADEAPPFVVVAVEASRSLRGLSWFQRAVSIQPSGGGWRSFELRPVVALVVMFRC